MTKRCTMKEVFVERKLDEFQPAWRDGEDISADTKQKIRNYVASRMPEEFKDDIVCFTDYSIWHMAKKIRERENLSEPKRSNRGNRGKVSVCQPREGYRKDISYPVSEECFTAGNNEPIPVLEAVRIIISRFGFDTVRKAWEMILSEICPVEETNPVMNYEPIASEEVATSGQDTINMKEDTIEIAPSAAKAPADEDEAKITDYVHHHPYCRIMDIAFGLKLKLLTIIPPLNSLAEKGVLIKTPDNLYVLKNNA